MGLYEEIDGFFNPKTVALIGASTKPGKIGYVILENLLDFPGKVYPIHPKAQEIHGLKCYHSVDDIPEKIDLAIIAIRSTDVPETIRKLADKGTKNVVIISGGFKELGGEFEDIEAQITRIAKEKGVRIIGPNCIGIFDPRTNIRSFFQPRSRMLLPKPGSVSILTQSGTYGIILLEWSAMDHLGVSKFVSYGNKADVDEADLLLYLKDEPNTKVIGIYLEGLKDGRKFYEAAKEVTKTKPVVVLRGGNTEKAKKAVKSHTGFLGGGGRIYKDVFKQAGIILARNLEDLYDIIKALAKQPPARGNRIAMMSNGAGLMVQAVDAIEYEGMELAEFTEETIKKLKERLPSYAIISNPLDLTGSATDDDYYNAIDIVLDDPNTDIILVFFVHQDSPVTPSIIDKLAELNKKAREKGKPILVGASGGPYTLELNRRTEQIGIPTYPISERIVRAAWALYHWGQRKLQGNPQ